MAKQTINIGTYPNDGTGDSLRIAFDKCNDNFDELYSHLGSDVQIPSQTNQSGKYLTTNGTTLSWGTVSGGTADTGDVTFDGVKIIGAGDASGDGNGYSTLELVPDNSLYENGQYLVIDPTAPSHIHIRAGGLQDSSPADLILGGENNYVRVRDYQGVRLQNVYLNDTFHYYDSSTYTEASWFVEGGNNYVQITSTTSLLINHLWDFTNGTPNQLIIYDGEASYTVDYGGSGSNLGGDVYKFQVVQAPPGGSPLVPSALELHIFTSTTNAIQLENNDLRVEVGDDIRMYARDAFRLYNYSVESPIEIITNFDNSEYTWTFNANGTMSFPNNTLDAGNSAIDVKSSSYVELKYQGLTENWQANPSYNSESYIWTAYDGTFIENVRADDGVNPSWDHVWSFANDGKLYGPGMGSTIFGGAMVSANTQLAIGSYNEHSNFLINTFNEPHEGQLVLTSVPANQMVLHGSDQGPNNMWGYPVSFFDEGLLITGYSHIHNNHEIVNNEGGSLDLVTNVVTTPNPVVFTSSSFASITWNGNNIVFSEPSNPLRDAIYATHIGESITVVVGSVPYVVDLTTRYAYGSTIEVNTASPVPNAVVSEITINVPTVSMNKWSFDASGHITLPENGGNIYNSDGISVIDAWPQNAQPGDADYTLTIEDAGKHIYRLTDTNWRAVLVPTHDNVPFGIGVEIRVVSGEYNLYIKAVDPGATDIWGAGFNTTSQYFFIPPNSIATLIKVENEKWILSGFGLAID